MVLISHEKKFIYIKNFKVAGTSVEAFFEKYCLDPKIEYQQTHQRDSIISKYGIIGNRENGKRTKFYNHISAKDIKDFVGEQIFNNYLKFCVVRNPYDKMVSYYHFSKTKMSFENFCKKYNCSNYKRYFINDKSCIDYYIRFENLEEDVKNLCKKLNINYDKNNLPSFKSNFRKKNDDYRKYYNNDLKKIVYERHKKEFEMFGYDF